MPLRCRIVSEYSCGSCGNSSRCARSRKFPLPRCHGNRGLDKPKEPHKCNRLSRDWGRETGAFRGVSRRSARPRLRSSALCYGRWCLAGMQRRDERSDPVNHCIRSGARGLACPCRFRLGILRVLCVHLPGRSGHRHPLRLRRPDRDERSGILARLALRRFGRSRRRLACLQSCVLPQGSNRSAVAILARPCDRRSRHGVLRALGNDGGFHGAFLRSFSCHRADRGGNTCDAMVEVPGRQWCVGRSVGHRHPRARACAGCWADDPGELVIFLKMSHSLRFARAGAKRLVSLRPSERILRAGSTQNLREERLHSPLDN
jgi:hypothetical protein